MEMSQGNTLYSVLKQKCQFFKKKHGEQKGKTGLVLGGWYQWGGEDIRKDVGG
jgi:hypothetical protein